MTTISVAILIYEKIIGPLRFNDTDSEFIHELKKLRRDMLAKVLSEADPDTEISEIISRYNDLATQLGRRSVLTLS